MLIIVKNIFLNKKTYAHMLKEVHARAHTLKHVHKWLILINMSNKTVEIHNAAAFV